MAPSLIHSKAVILATGRFLSGGLEAHITGVTESLLDLPVSQPASRTDWYCDGYTDRRGHAIHKAGIEIDSSFRPLAQNGKPYNERLFAAGIIIAHQDWIRGRSGAGIAIATAYKAVEAAEKFLHAYALQTPRRQKEGKVMSNKKIPTINFKEKAIELLPPGASFEACLTCGLCSSGCPASGIENMDPRKFIRMAMLGMDEELSTTPWVWCCTLCKRCQHVCPMNIDISQLVFLARGNWPQEEKPSGIVRSCQLIRSTDSTSAMGLPPEDFVFVVQDVLEEVRETQPAFKNLQAPMDKKGAHFFVNQNSREPMNEPDEMVPLWKIFDLVGADWTYSSKGWAAENFCMFSGDEEAWYEVIKTQGRCRKRVGLQGMAEHRMRP